MRVLFVNPIGALGGSERSLLDLLISLRAAAPDAELRLLLFADGDLRELAERAGVEVDVLPLPPALSRWGEAGRPGVSQTVANAARGALRTPPFMRRLRARVRSFDPTLVHTNGMKAHLMAAVALRDRSLVLHVRDFPSERPVSRYLFPLLGRKNAVVVANSDAVARDVRTLAPKLSVRVVHNGVDTTTFSPGPRRGELSRLASLPELAPNGLAVGLVATYAFWKGHRLFLEAARRVLDAELAREIRFYLVGGALYGTHGSELSVSDLERMIDELGLQGHVGLVPFQTDVARVYRELDVVVHASTRPEPFGRTIVEAMAVGCPVVVARAGGAAELFEEGRSGVGFIPGDASDLARAILTVVRDEPLRALLSAGGQDAARTRFDRSRLGPQLLAVYEELLARTR